MLSFSKLPTDPATASSDTAVIAADTETFSLNLSSVVPSSASLFTAIALESAVSCPAGIVIVKAGFEALTASPFAPTFNVTVTSLFAT